jgi:hypothetical protein
LQISLPPHYSHQNCELVHNFIPFYPQNLKEHIMSKELNIIDTLVAESAEVAVQPEMIKLDDLSLALVGGGAVGVAF